MQVEAQYLEELPDCGFVRITRVGDFSIAKLGKVSVGHCLFELQRSIDEIFFGDNLADVD